MQIKHMVGTKGWEQEVPEIVDTWEGQWTQS